MVETYFASNAKTPYRVRFYGSNGNYWFSMIARERKGIYSANTYIDREELNDTYGDGTYYIVMYNDFSESAVDAIYSINR